MGNIIYKEECYEIIGASMDVHNEMGSGFLEAVYHECLQYAFTDRQVNYVSQRKLSLRYKQRPLKSYYVPDFICFEAIIVEIKGVSDLNASFRAQMINYLKATGLKLGLLINFGQPNKLQYERLVL